MTNELREAFAKAVERSRRLLSDGDDAEAVAPESAMPRAQYRDDGFNSDWHAGMPQPEPVPHPDNVSMRTLTDAEALALRNHLEARLSEEREIQREVGALAIAHERKRHRAELEKLSRKIESLLDVFADLLASTDKLEKSLRTEDRKVVDLPSYSSWTKRNG